MSSALDGVHIVGKGHPAHRRIVPQKSVSQGADHKGYGDLAVALGQFQHAPLQVQVRLLILSHAVYFFIFVGIKPDGESVFASAGISLPFPVHDLQAAAGPRDRSAVGTEVFPQDQISVPVEADHPGKIDHSPDPSVFNFRVRSRIARAVRRALILTLADADPAVCFFRLFSQCEIRF